MDYHKLAYEVLTAKQRIKSNIRYSLEEVYETLGHIGKDIGYFDALKYALTPVRFRDTSRYDFDQKDSNSDLRDMVILSLTAATVIGSASRLILFNDPDSIDNAKFFLEGGIGTYLLTSPLRFTDNHWLDEKCYFEDVKHIHRQS